MDMSIYNTAKLNDVFYFIKRDVESYLQSGINSYLKKALIGYIIYKKRKGKKSIKFLDEKLKDINE